jgi:hypothetical protein
MYKLQVVDPERNRECVVKEIKNKISSNRKEHTKQIVTARNWVLLPTIIIE